MEAGGGWCSTAIMVPSRNKTPILATGRLHGPLKFVAFAYVRVVVFHHSRVCGDFSAGLRGAAQVCLEVAPDGCRSYNICRLYYLCVVPGSWQNACFNRTQDGLEQMQKPTVAFHCFAQGL